jgi:hypothetical protein
VGSGDVLTILDRLQTQVLARKIERPEGTCYELAEHLRERWPLTGGGGAALASLVSDQAAKKSGDLVTDQVHQEPLGVPKAGRPIEELTEQQRRLLAACDTPRSQAELLALLGVKHRAFFSKRHLQPLIDGGLLQLTHPDQPTDPRQRYSLTPVGAEIVARQIKGTDR